jgi:hypothetical protein
MFLRDILLVLVAAIVGVCGIALRGAALHTIGTPF